MRLPLKLFSYFLAGALAFVALVNPTAVEAQEEAPGVVTINVTSTDPDVASAMPADASWTVTDGENIMSDTFAEGDLELPAEIVTNQAIPGGAYTVTVNAEPVFETFNADFTIDGDSVIDVALTPVPVEIDPEPGIVTINVSSADPDVANTMPIGSSWTVTDGVNSISDVFVEGDLDLPANIVTNNPIPGGTYTATVDAGPDFALFTADYVVDGDTSVEVVLTPVPAEPVIATVNVAAYACEGLTAPGLLTDIGDDCTPATSSFDFYLSGDGTDVPAYTLPVDGSATIDVQVGTYEVWAADGTLFDLVVPAEGASFAYGYPAEDPVETGTVTANVWHCLALETPGMLTDIGDDCIPGPGTFDFYLIGDGTDDSVRLTVGDDGTNTATLAAGEYEVYEVSTDTRLNNVVVTAGENSAFNFGIPRVEAPPTETGILSVSTYICEDLDEAVVLGEIGDDCVRTSTNLSFYLWGDGTDQNWPLTTSDAGAVDHELPVGIYEVVDEPTQWTFSATVVAEGSEIAFGIPAAAAPVDPPADPPADPADPKDSPVTGLPETGTGTSSGVGALGALVSGALLAAGALGVRIRKS